MGSRGVLRWCVLCQGLNELSAHCLAPAVNPLSSPTPPRSPRLCPYLEIIAPVCGYEGSLNAHTDAAQHQQADVVLRHLVHSTTCGREAGKEGRKGGAG